jgi:hypothetical protein
MSKRTTWVAAGWLVLASGCGGGGGGQSTPGGIASPSLGTVQLLDHAPNQAALQVAVDAGIEFLFDSVIALDSLGDQETWLRVAGSSSTLPGSFHASEGGQRIRFQPAAPLLRETDYEFQLSGLTCDLQGRLLDRNFLLSFRTLDESPPVLLHVSVSEGAQNQARDGSFTFTFQERIAAASLTPDSLYLRDGFGRHYPGSRKALGHTVVFAPFAELPGERDFTLVMTTAVTDVAGNALQNGSAIQFRTWDDHDRPSVVSIWPAEGSTGISPLVQPTYTFNESMDADSVEVSSLRFEDEFHSIVPFVVHASADQRTLRIEPLWPLQPHRRYILTFLLGAAAVTDVSGNSLNDTQSLSFTTGDDAVAPVLLRSDPAAGQTRISGNAVITLEFDEALDPSWVDQRLARMSAGDEEIVALIEQSLPNVLRLTPVAQLPTDRQCLVTVQGGHEGLRDLAGNVLAEDLVFGFTTSSDDRLPNVQMLPANGATNVPRGSCVSLIFATPMDPATLLASTIEVCDDGWQPLPGNLTVHDSHRVVHFQPETTFAPNTFYRTRIRGGSQGVRTSSGNWFAADQSARFRTGNQFDSTPPTVRARLNGIDEARNQGLVLPPHGFTIEVQLTDAIDHAADPGSIEILCTGETGGPSPAQLLAAASISQLSMVVTVPAEPGLNPGNWTLQVRAKDLSGNLGNAPPLTFRVTEPTATILPFERTQVVWVRTDLDRSRSGMPDFDEDMLRLGFATAGDPLGTNAWMRELVLDGILAKANQLFGRGNRGEPLGPESVALRFAKRQPIALVHMQIAMGGLDPEGRRGRVYGDASSGVLGRAYYDYRNGNMGDRNIATSPGLGVFPAEMWLFQARIHEQVWPSFQTLFAQRFRPLCPDMGGIPAGSHALDGIILRPEFQYETAPSNQRARWLVVMQAAEDWANVVGIILAHEVGHAVGLVAPGPSPRGLHGDNTLHNTYAGATEVMAPSIGYEAMTTLEYSFRDLDLAYLRQRVLLR